MKKEVKEKKQNKKKLNGWFSYSLELIKNENFMM